MLMKRLFYLIALLAVAFTCQATPTIPTVGATIPTGNKNEGAPGTVFYLCKRTYKATRINDNGTLSNLEGYNYLEVHQGSSYYDPYVYSFKGLMGGIEPVWAMAWSYEWEYSGLLGLGQQVGKLSDGSVVYIYPVEIIQNIDGKYLFKILREGATVHHPSLGVVLYYNIKDVSHGFDPESPYPFYIDMSDGYAFFTETRNGDLVPVDNCMYYDTRIVPTGDNTYAPPSDATYTLSQILSLNMGFWPFYDDVESFPKQGRFINIATKADSIYVKNLFPESGSLWLKGRLENGKAIFNRGDVVASRGEVKRLGVYSWMMDDPSDPKKIMLSPVNDNLSFDYDPITNTLSNPSAAFDGVADIDLNVKMDFYKLAYNKPSVYIDAEITPWENKPLTPQSPVIIAKLGVIDMFEQGPHAEFLLSDISQEGMLMDSERLYYHFTINDNIPVEVTLKDNYGRDYVTADIPFNYSGHLNEQETCVIQNGYRWYVYYDSDDIEKISIQLIYEAACDKRYSDLVTGIDEIAGPSPATESPAVFDLQGRQVDPDRLAPGIYVRSGRKFIKR